MKNQKKKLFLFHIFSNKKGYFNSNKMLITKQVYCIISNLHLRPLHLQHRKINCSTLPVIVLMLVFNSNNKTIKESKSRQSLHCLLFPRYPSNFCVMAFTDLIEFEERKKIMKILCSSSP